MDDTSGGTYTLLVELTTDARIGVGALGERDFPAGWYAYTGSALGSGGFARVDRHHELAAGQRTTHHWHIDYLLDYADARLATDVRSPGADVECAVARRLPDGPIAGFGASDCDCESHLSYASERKELLRTVRSAHEAARS